MSIGLQGVGVSRGIAIGKVHIVERDRLDITEYAIETDEIAAEIDRFETALASAGAQLRSIREHIPRGTPGDIAVFIDTHLLMLEDYALTAETTRLIRSKRCNAEWALKLQYDALVDVFDQMDDPYLRTRKDDISHVVNRVQRILLNQGPLHHEIPDQYLRDCIVLADDLTPADTILMQHHGIAAFATEYGGPTSHTAILARSLGIPSVVGLHQARRYALEDDLIVIDGRCGVVIIDPDAQILSHYRQRQEADKCHYAELIKLKEAPTVTADGVPIELHANIELPNDVDVVRAVGAGGVGLYRTEFLFLNRTAAPDEDEHFNTYAEILEALQDKPVTIRTLDFGADKAVTGGTRDGPVAANPALGLRAVRYCLREPSIFRPQLRAIIRASALGPVRLLIPMLSNIHEVRQVLAIVEEIQQQLANQGIDFDAEMPIGAMIEVPAAAICADMFAKEMDFLSIGTNDLIQYTIALDRVNDEVNYLYDPLHPGVLRLIRTTIEAGAAAQTAVAMCGEMAGDVRYVRLLLGLGLRAFSVHPAELLEVKRLINSSRIDELEQIAGNVLADPDGSDIRRLVEGAEREATPCA